MRRFKCSDLSGPELQTRELNRNPENRTEVYASLLNLNIRFCNACGCLCVDSVEQTLGENMKSKLNARIKRAVSWDTTS